MRINMITTMLGSRDGLRVESFLKGVTYDLTGSVGERDLAAVFVREGWAAEAAPGANANAEAEAEAAPDPAAADAAPGSGTVVGREEKPAGKKGRKG